jgi:hypothetical protein
VRPKQSIRNNILAFRLKVYGLSIHPKIVTF